MVRELIAHGADVDSHTKDDGTFPLYFAAMSNHVSVVKVLLESRADPNKATRVNPGHGWTPICVAAVGGHVDVVRLLLDNGGDPTRALLADNTSAVHLAAKRGHRHVVEMLLTATARRAAVQRDTVAMRNLANDKKQTPFHYAASGGQLEIIHMMIVLGESLDVRDQWGETPESAVVRYKQ